MAAIDKMLDQFKELSDLQAFARAQQKTIVDLTKKNKALEEEVKHLKKLLESTVPIIKVPEENKIDFNASDEEAIAREQLFKLKDISKERELTLEETKRVEIYSKILAALKNQQTKPIDVSSRKLSDAELIAALKNGNNDRENE